MGFGNFGKRLEMKTVLWTIDFNTGARIFVSASTVKIAIRNAVEGYNKDMNGHLTSADIDMVHRGKIEYQCPTCGV